MKTPIAILPKVYKPKSTAKRQEWFVFFSYINPATGRMERFRVWEGFADCSTIKEKEKHGYNLVRAYNRKLKNGWNPFANEDILFSEDLQEDKKPKASKFTTQSYLWTSYNQIKVGLCYGTYKNYRLFTERFITWLGSNKLDKLDIYYITPDHATAFLNYLTTDLKQANKYRNEHHSYLKKAFALIGKEVIGINPFENCKKLKKAHRPGAYYKEGIKNIIKPALEQDPKLWLFVNFIYYTCIRPKELRALKIGDINVFDGSIKVRGDISKNGKTQNVVIPFQLYEKILLMKLEQYPEDFYLFGAMGEPGKEKIGINFFNKRFRKLRDRLGIPKEYKLYSWKHTANVTAIKGKDINIKEMQLHNRHGDLNTFDIYISGMVPEDSEGIRYEYPTL